MSTPADHPVGRAVRLLFTSDRGHIRLLSQQPVDIAITGFDVAPDQRAGDFVEVRDETGRQLSRARVQTGLDTSLEVFPEQTGGAITRVPASGRTQAFTVVVPAGPAAVRVAVVRVRRPGRHAATAHATGSAELASPASAMQTTELVSFSLDR